MAAPQKLYTKRGFLKPPTSEDAPFSSSLAHAARPGKKKGPRKRGPFFEVKAI
jgi:hypothetical protein